MKNIFIVCIGALLSSVLLTAASPGHDIWYVAYFALIPMLLAITYSKRGFLTAWLFGTAYFIMNIHWVVNAVSEFGNAPLLVGWVVAVLFSALLGLFWGVFGWLYIKKRGANLLLACVIVALEVAKSTIFTGFPMLNLSHTQYSFLPTIQIAEITGAFGVSLIISYMNVSLASAVTDKNRQSVIFAIIFTLASLIYGYTVQNRDYAGSNLKVRVIQPAYSQAEKWIPEKKYDHMAVVNGLLRQPQTEKLDMILLPETVYPAFLNESFAGYQMLDIAGEHTPVIAGGMRFTEKDEKRSYRNSVFLFDKNNVSLYDKLHLVPFGEYFPLKTLFKPIDFYFFQGAEDFTPGSEPTVFVADKFTAAPMICYESMYSHLVRDQVMLGADIITVVTNDSWFGDTTGPYQHLAADVMRAVEFRKPLLRAAQSGISACIDPSGKINGIIPLGVKDSLDCNVTTHKGLTLFATGGYGWLAVFLFAAWYFSRRKNP